MAFVRPSTAARNVGTDAPRLEVRSDQHAHLGAHTAHVELVRRGAIGPRIDGERHAARAPGDGELTVEERSPNHQVRLAERLGDLGISRSRRRKQRVVLKIGEEPDAPGSQLHLGAEVVEEKVLVGETHFSVVVEIGALKCGTETRSRG